MVGKSCVTPRTELRTFNCLDAAFRTLHLLIVLALRRDWAGASRYALTGLLPI
jgi:hypothetical protein